MIYLLTFFATLFASQNLFAADPNIGRLSRFLEHSYGGFSFSKDGKVVRDEEYWKRSEVGSDILYTDDKKSKGTGTADNRVLIEGKEGSPNGVSYVKSFPAHWTPLGA